MTVRAVVERIDGQMLYQAGTLTDTAGHLFCRMCMLAIGGVYWFKQVRNQKKYQEEGD